MSRLEKARSEMLVPPDWSFRLARRKHRAGHYRHDYDEGPKGGRPRSSILPLGKRDPAHSAQRTYPQDFRR